MTFEKLVAMNPHLKDKSPLIVISTVKLKEMKADLIRQLGEIEFELADREAFLFGLKQEMAKAKAHLN